jgi:hypothetical protein
MLKGDPQALKKSSPHRRILILLSHMSTEYQGYLCNTSSYSNSSHFQSLELCLVQCRRRRRRPGYWLEITMLRYLVPRPPQVDIKLQQLQSLPVTRSLWKVDDDDDDSEDFDFAMLRYSVQGLPRVNIILHSIKKGEKIENRAGAFFTPNRGRGKFENLPCKSTYHALVSLHMLVGRKKSPPHPSPIKKSLLKKSSPHSEIENRGTSFFQCK